MSPRQYGYSASQTWLHRLDALSKFIWVFAVSFVSFVFWQPWQLGIQVLILFVIALSISREQLWATLRVWALFAFLSSLILFFHLMNQHTGVRVWQLGILSIYSDGVHDGLMYALRILSIMGSSFVFIQTTSPRELVVGLVHLGIPYKYAWMIFLTMLSVPVFEAQAVTVKEAQLVRGIRPSKNPLQERLQMYQRYVLPLLVSGLRRVEGLGIAMDSRGFAALPERTFIDEFRWTAWGLVFGGIWSVLFIVLLAVRIIVIR